MQISHEGAGYGANKQTQTRLDIKSQFFSNAAGEDAVGGASIYFASQTTRAWPTLRVSGTVMLG